MWAHESFYKKIVVVAAILTLENAQLGRTDLILSAPMASIICGMTDELKGSGEMPAETSLMRRPNGYPVLDLRCAVFSRSKCDGSDCLEWKSGFLSPKCGAEEKNCYDSAYLKIVNKIPRESEKCKPGEKDCIWKAEKSEKCTPEEKDCIWKAERSEKCGPEEKDCIWKAEKSEKCGPEEKDCIRKAEKSEKCGPEEKDCIWKADKSEKCGPEEEDCIWKSENKAKCGPEEKDCIHDDEIKPEQKCGAEEKDCIWKAEAKSKCGAEEKDCIHDEEPQGQQKCGAEEKDCIWKAKPKTKCGPEEIDCIHDDEAKSKCGPEDKDCSMDQEKGRSTKCGAEEKNCEWKDPCANSVVEDEYEDAGTRVIGGALANEGEAPWDVNLKYVYDWGPSGGNENKWTRQELLANDIKGIKESHRCTGVLYNRRTLVTTAWCGVKGEEYAALQNRFVAWFARKRYLFNEWCKYESVIDPKQKRNCDVYLHPDFKGNIKQVIKREAPDREHDISIVRFRFDLNKARNPLVHAIQFARKGQEFRGWGTTNQSFTGSQVGDPKQKAGYPTRLSKIKLRLINFFPTCERAVHLYIQKYGHLDLKKNYSEIYMCATPEDPKLQGLCAGDSGGALICEEGGKQYVCGVRNSWGATKDCLKDGDKTEIFLKISYYIDWIEKTVGPQKAADLKP